MSELDEMNAVPDGSAILDEAETFLRRFVAFPSEHAGTAVTLWAAHAHVVNTFRTSPRLALLSAEPDSGKTRVLEVLEVLTPDPQLLLNISTAAMFRLVDADQPTILLDEVDSIFTHKGKDDDNADLRAVINNGYRKGGQVPRCVGTKNELKRFLVYAALAMAGLGDLPDTLMRRSVVVRMRRAAPHEHVEDFDYDEHADSGWELRTRLADWLAATHLERKPAMPSGVRGRFAECWRPLIAIADAAGGDWPKRAREASAAFVHAPTAGREVSLGVRLLDDIHAAFGSDEKLSTQVLLNRLRALEESPWDDLKGKPLDANRLARMLAQYQTADGEPITSKTIRVEDRTPKGYRREDFHDAWQRYVESESPPAQPQHPQQGEHPSAQGGDGVAPADAQPPRGNTADTLTEAVPSDVAPVAPVAAAREETECCKGGPLVNWCDLCTQSPNYWKDTA